MGAAKMLNGSSTIGGARGSMAGALSQFKFGAI